MHSCHHWTKGTRCVAAFIPPPQALSLSGVPDGRQDPLVLYPILHVRPPPDIHQPIRNRPIRHFHARDQQSALDGKGWGFRRQ